MSTQWTVPGTRGGDPSDSSDGVDAVDSSGPGASGGGAATGGPGLGDGREPADGWGGSPAGPRRELTAAMTLFPLRPLSLAEMFGAAMRIYRLRARTVLGVAAAVYGVAFVLMTGLTGVSMVPMVGQMRAEFENPDAALTATPFGTASEIMLTATAYLATMIVTLLATSLVTVALTRVALGEATGEHVSSEQMWATVRRRGVPAIGVGLVISVASVAAFAALLALGAAPLMLLQEATWWTIAPVVLGFVFGMLAVVLIWARTVLAVPALVIEEVGVLRALSRSLLLTRGRRLWRTLGTAVLLYLTYTIAVQVIGGVFGTIGVIVYVAVLLASSFEAVVAAVIVLTVLTMLGSYVATVLLAPFLSSGFVALYADSRMRHEAWDVELVRRARAAWTGDPR